MAATKSNTSTSAKKTTAKKPAAKTAAKPKASPAANPVEKAPVAEAPVARPTAKEIDVNQYVTVRNGFHGHLVYKSSHTGELFEWDEFGEEQEMQLLELRNAKNSAKGFFRNNWFMFDEPWIIDYLGVGKFYQHALNLDEFKSLFDKTPEEVAMIISDMSDGQKRTVVYLAAEKIRNGEIDSRKMIATLENALNVKLVES